MNPDGSISLNRNGIKKMVIHEKCGYLSSNKICKACMLLNGLK